MARVAHHRQRCPLPLALAILSGLACSASAQIERAWIAPYLGPGSASVVPVALALDEDGDLHIAALIRSPTQHVATAILTVRVSREGRWLWAHEHAGAFGESRPAAIAVGADGRTVVAGESKHPLTDFDISVHCLDDRGALLWHRTRDGGAGGADSATGVALDPKGDVIVAGSSASADGGRAAVVLKYGAGGDLLWEGRHDGNLEPTRGIAVDATGRIHLAATTRLAEGARWLAIQYAPDGTELWKREHGGAGAGACEAAAIALDRGGNLLVAGTSRGATDVDSDYETVKCSPDGTELWARRWAGPAGAEDIPVAIGVDPQGNVLVTGGSGASEAQTDFVTVKYSPAGAEIWARRHDGSAGGLDRPAGLAVDRSGSVLVAGTSRVLGGAFELATVTYSPDGAELWASRIAGATSLVARGLAVDTDGRAALLGKAPGAMAAAAIDPEGALLWVRADGGPADTGVGVVALALDGGDNVVVAGSVRVRGTGLDWATVKFAPDGRQLWLQTCGGPTHGDDTPAAVAVGPDGSVHVTGRSVGPRGSDSDYMTVKYSADGRELWARRHDGPLGEADGATGIALDAIGDVVVTGESWGSLETGLDFVTVRYSPDGAELWARRYGGPEPGNDRPVGVVVDTWGNAVVAGESWGGSMARRDFAIVKYAPDGAELWERRYDAGADDLPVAVATDAAGNVLVTGTSRGASKTGLDIATMKLSPGGTGLWVRRFDGEKAGHDAPSGMAVDAAGCVHVAGTSYGGTAGLDAVVLKYDPDGNELWVRRQEELRGEVGEFGKAVALDAAGNLLAAGRLRYYGDGFLAKRDSEGAQLWVRTLGEQVAAFAVGSRGDVYLTGGGYMAARYEPLSFRRGLVDGDDRMNIADAIRLLDHVHRGGAAPACLDAADADDSGDVDPSDAALILRHLFLGGDPPPGPFGDCGRDETLDGIDCNRSPACDGFGDASVVRFGHLEFRAGAVVFVAGASTRSHDSVLGLTKRYLSGAVRELPEGMEVGVVFFHDEALSFPAGGVPRPLDEAVRRDAEASIESVEPGPGSCCLEGLEAGLRLAEGATAARTAIVLVGDGSGTCGGEEESRYLERALGTITDRNAGRFEIHALGILDVDTVRWRFLGRLAAANGGTFADVVR